MSRNPEPLPTSAFDYPLPADLIAQYPAPQRDASRLLVLNRATGEIGHRTFHDLVQMVAPVDALVVNETRVFPARLRGHKLTGAAAEVLLLRPVGSMESALWHALVRPGAKLRGGSRIVVGDDLEIEVAETTADGVRMVRLVASGGIASALEKHGRVPLPPYIDREPVPEDTERYQTVYARETGSVAAPTAGLHLTPALLTALGARGVRVVRLVLHVGLGTFRPVEVKDPAEHRMHEEEYCVSAEAADAIHATRAAGGRIWAVGTTVVRTLETLAQPGGTVHAGAGRTSIFIRPPYRFRAVDCLITNFHLPRSTLLMLVCAFGGHDAVMQAYREAIRLRYRFYSYGDAMAIIEE